VSSLENEPAKQSKKPYRKPDLQVYGSLPQLTMTVGMGSNADNLSPGNSNKTH
jgi:hypothetical protein